MPKILSFEKNSVLKKYGLKAGDELTAFDGYRYVDDLDYLFFDAKEDFTVTYLRSGESITVRIKKDGDRSMGAVLEDVPIEPIECRNKCVFCFVDQMKKGMRETLYIKDDDYRLSVI
ncbi:MAG: hypothetical protein LBT20_04550, partial [Clostridiales bacterium]|nr:hypothetical protein [Clostridiales bacterium]